MARERVRRVKESLGGVATLLNGKMDKGQSRFVPTSVVASSA